MLPDAAQLLPYAVACLGAHAAIAAAAAVGPLSPTLGKLYWTRKKWLGLLSGQLAIGASVAALVVLRRAPLSAAESSSAGASYAASLPLSLALGFTHFLLMEGAGTGSLLVRPAAYVAVAAAAAPLALLYIYTLAPALSGA
jgi:hypothetical protein